jgi:hypothetical protein
LPEENGKKTNPPIQQRKTTKSSAPRAYLSERRVAAGALKARRTKASIAV